LPHALVVHQPQSGQRAPGRPQALSAGSSGRSSTTTRNGSRRDFESRRASLCRGRMTPAVSSGPSERIGIGSPAVPVEYARGLAGRLSNVSCRNVVDSSRRCRWNHLRSRTWLARSSEQGPRSAVSLRSEALSLRRHDRSRSDVRVMSPEPDQLVTSRSVGPYETS
jgi:hypothetical protein